MATSSSTPNPAPRRKPPIAIITAGIAVAVVLVAIVVTQGGAGVRFENGQATLNVATVDECQQVVYYYAPGVDTQQATEALFEAARMLEGVGTVTAFENPPSIQVNFCQSAVAETEIRAALAQTGVLAPVGGALPTTPAAPAPVSPGAAAPATPSVAPTTP
ncbi:MAG: hypothetical protein KGZ89_07195 [Actinobacteria bacterium]|nr:hypothetical protein [Actinomycetota bacterium]